MKKDYNTELDYILEELIKVYEYANEGVKFYSGQTPKTTKEEITQKAMVKFGLKEWELNDSTPSTISQFPSHEPREDTETGQLWDIIFAYIDSSSVIEPDAGFASRLLPIRVLKFATCY